MFVYNQPISEIFSLLKTSKQGLTQKEAELRLSQNGLNVLKSQKKVGFFARFFAQFKNLMVIVLLISAFISTTIALLSKEYSDIFEGGLIFIIVIINAIIGVFQEKRAEDAIKLLNKRSEPYCKVLRDGKTIKIPSEQVVVGDIVSLKAGDFVPADIRLITSNNLKCDESTLTGESEAVFKNADASIKDSSPLAEQENMCFSGTSCTFGNGTGVVVRTAAQTEMGKIAKLLTEKTKEKTPLEKNIDKIGKFITYGVLIIVAIVFIAELIFSKDMSFMDAFLIAVALAVAAIPESLPAVITIVMALGVERLAKHKAIVKTLSSVETLGCCSVICSDKTGTLTENKMTVKHMFINGEITENFKQNNQTQNELYRAITLCNNATIGADNSIIGDATETSLYSLSRQNYSLFYSDISMQRKAEIPFDSTRKIMSVIYKIDDKEVLYSKGAYDYLIERCSFIEINGNTLPLSTSIKLGIEKAIIKLGQKAERVLAVTKKVIGGSSSDTNETNLVFLGLVGIIDPPRKEAKESIKSCKKAGLKPIMITGDHPETAFAIAKEIGLAKSRAEIITGAEIDIMSVKELSEKADKYSVYARVSPEHKVKIVTALKKTGKVVAMTGDGVNDAPSISKADIGVCMGITGTDVTKSVADLIITDDNFSTIVVAVKQGRTIYQNIQKIILFLMSTNAVEVLGIFIATIVMRDSIFLLPSQILFINLVTDSFPAFALGLEKPEKNIMEKPPRDPKDTIFSGVVGTSILYQSFVQTLLVLVVFVVGIHFYSNEVASTMVFLIICLMQIIHAINCKTEGSIFKINIFSNKSFNLSFIGLFALIMLVANVPFLQVAFSIVKLNLTQWLIVIFSSISIIPLVEICKLIVNSYYFKKQNRILSEKRAKVKSRSKI